MENKYKLLKIIFFLISILALTGCLATKQDSVNIRLELKELRKEIHQFKKINANLLMDLEAQKTYLQQIGGKMDESNYRFTEMTLRKESLSEISKRLASIEDKLFKLWVSTTPIASALPEDIYDMARKDYVRGNYDLAVFGFRRLIEEYPDSSIAPQAQYELAITYYTMGAFDKAYQETEVFTILYEDSNLMPKVLLVKARALKNLGEHIKAQKIFKSIIKDYSSVEEAKIAKEELQSYD